MYYLEQRLRLIVNHLIHYLPRTIQLIGRLHVSKMVYGIIVFFAVYQVFIHLHIFNIKKKTKNRELNILSTFIQICYLLITSNLFFLKNHYLSFSLSCSLYMFVNAKLFVIYGYLYIYNCRLI